MFDVSSISASLIQAEDGIWYGPEDAAISYPEHGNEGCFAVEDRSFWFKHRNACITEAVTSFPPGDVGPIFDIGGGNGFVSLGLASAGLDVVLVEPGRSGAANAKKRGIANIICASTQAAHFRENSLSAVGLFDVLEHIEDDKAFLQSINAVLKNSGMLYLTVPAYAFLWSNEDRLAGHFRRYTLKTLSAILGSTGFEVIYSSYIFRFLPIPIFLCRTVPDKLGLTSRAHDSEKAAHAHAASSTLAARILNRLLATEVASLRNRKTMRYGGSCLIVARKMPQESCYE